MFPLALFPHTNLEWMNYDSVKFYHFFATAMLFLKCNIACLQQCDWPSTPQPVDSASALIAPQDPWYLAFFGQVSVTMQCKCLLGLGKAAIRTR